MSKIAFIAGDRFDAYLVALNKSASKLATDIQLGLASSVLLAVRDGNVATLNGMMVAVGKGVRKPAMANWLLKFAPVVLNDNKEGAKEQPFKFSADKLALILKAYDAEGAKAGEERADAAEEAATVAYKTMWTEYKEPPLVPETWSLTDAVKKLIATAKGYEAKGTKVSGGDILGDLEDLLPAEVEPI